MSMKSFLQSKRIKGDLILLLAASIWGSGFIAQRLGAVHISFFYFNSLRFLLGALVMLLVLNFNLRFTSRESKVGLTAGIFLFAGASFQQAGLELTTAGKAGFITGLYVVIIPILLSIFGKEKFHHMTWMAVIIAMIGMGLLSLEGSLGLSSGDLMVLGSSFMWAFHVILIGRNIHAVNALKISFLQNTVCMALSFLGGFFFENLALDTIVLAAPALLYSGIISIGLAYTLQLVGQQYAPPVDSAIIMSMESVFALVFGISLLAETITLKQGIGCILMFSAMLLAQIPSIQNHLRQKKKGSA